MECPRDQSKMKVERHEAGFNVDVCPTCSGKWFDKGELDAVQKRTEREVQLGEIRVPEEVDLGFSKRLQSGFGPIDCPRCGARMETKDYERWAKVVVDVCPKGCGLWLDRNELEALEKLFERNVFEKEAMWATLTSAFGG